MRKWKALGGLLAFCALAQVGLAQDIRSRMQQMEARLSKVEAENQQLRARIADSSDQALEQQVNALLETYQGGTTVNSAANPVTLTGEFRFRNTWTIGDADNGDELEGSYNDARVRLGFQYEFTRDVTAFAELQAHWAFGDDTSATFGQSSSPLASPVGFFHGEARTDVELYQGYIEVRNIFNKPQFSSRTGRQEIVLGNQFQFGNADWYNGWSFDGTVWTWDDESFRVVGIVAKLSSTDRDLNQTPSYFSAHDDDELYSVYFTLKTIENHELDVYWIYVNGHGIDSNGSLGGPVGGFAGTLGGVTSNGNAYFHTFGVRVGGTFPDIAAGLDWNAEAAFQTGNLNGGFPTNDIKGWTIEAEVGVTFNKDKMLRVWARFLFADGGDSDETGYLPLYPNRHSNTGFRARYGIFDLMPMTNVLSIGGGVHFDPDPAWTLGASVLWATTDEQTIVSTSSTDDDYGFEVDVWGEYRYSDQLTMGAGVALLFPDDEGVALWGIDDDTHVLVYVQARLVF